MISFWRIFSLELKTLWRTRVLPVLAIVSIVWMAGYSAEREVYIRYSLYIEMAIVVSALLFHACGSFASERAAKRLQLTLIRPVRRLSIYFGKVLAIVFAGAVVLALALAVLLAKVDRSVSCQHVFSPVLPSPREEAEAMYEVFMSDPETSPEVKKAKKSEVLDLLEARAWEHYQTISPSNSVAWTFPTTLNANEPVELRIKLTTMFDQREESRCLLRAGDFESVITNVTLSAMKYELRPKASIPAEVHFENHGSGKLMLRPRKDVQLLTPADGFISNLARAYLELVGILALIVMGGTLLSSFLSRPVAVFTAFVMLLLTLLDDLITVSPILQLSQNEFIELFSWLR